MCLTISYYTMFQRSVNRSLTVIRAARLIAALGLIAVTSHCARLPAGLDLLPPWREARLVAETIPHEQPSLWADGTTTLIAWPGDPSAPGVYLADPTRGGQPQPLKLGTLPRRMSVYPASGDRAQLLWLDQTLPDEAHLVGAVIGPDRQVERSQTPITNRPTLDYRAAATASGEIGVVWVEMGERSTVLYYRQVDDAGLPHPPVRIAAPASYPRLAIDFSGRQHIAWLESGAPGLWAIHYLAFPGDQSPVPDSALVGVIRLETGEALESFELGADATHVHCLWNVVTAGDSRGQLAGLTFPIGDSAATRTLPMISPGQFSVRGLVMPRQGSSSLTVGLTASRAIGHDFPATVTVTPDGIGAVQPVTADSSSIGVIGKVSLAADASGNLYLAWTVLRENGVTAVYYASTRAQTP
jgi:hypothetical protein